MRLQQNYRKYTPKACLSISTYLSVRITWAVFSTVIQPAVFSKAPKKFEALAKQVYSLGCSFFNHFRGVMAKVLFERSTKMSQVFKTHFQVHGRGRHWRVGQQALGQ